MPINKLKKQLNVFHIFFFLLSRCSVHTLSELFFLVAFANFLTLPCVCVCGRVSAEHHRSCYMDQPIRGHLDNHSPVACGDHVHAPEDYPADAQDHPQVRHVPGTAHETL